jgi:hypothetical protein
LVGSDLKKPQTTDNEQLTTDYSYRSASMGFSRAAL